MDLLDKIYSDYVIINASESDLYDKGVQNYEDMDHFMNQTKDITYTPNELLSVIEKKKGILSQDNRFIYGEIKKSGVETLYKAIRNQTSELDTFVDVGSGTGKICLHLSLISDFENIVGIEIIEGRHLYALHLQDSLGVDFDNVIFLNDDILKIDFEKPLVVFTNDVCFPVHLTKMIWEKLPLGSHFISFNTIGNPVKKIYLDVSWQTEKIAWYYYIKT